MMMLLLTIIDKVQLASARDNLHRWKSLQSHPKNH